MDIQRAPYDDIAEWYDEQVRTDGFFRYVLPPLFDLIGEVQGQRICDLACGQGLITRQLFERGASVVGIDLSQRLLEIAQQQAVADFQPIVYQRDDAQVGRTLANESFDGVVCNLALMDIPDLQATLQVVARILRPAGWFVFSITHPFTQMPRSAWLPQEDGTIPRLSGDYFAEGFWLPAAAPGPRGRVGYHHRTLSTYLNTLILVGFHIEQLAEPGATGPGAYHYHAAYKQLPPALVVRCRKG
ncbi:MAG: class I SAM-dependent methyltransferase [Ktedonobacteraceae bacterium]